MKAPKGFKLTKHDGYQVNDRGFRITDETDGRRPLMVDGTIEVVWFDEDEPFVWSTNDGMGANASQAAKDAARAGNPLEGWNPNTRLEPIKDGWIPPVYTLQERGTP